MNAPIFEQDENLPGIPRFDWWAKPPKVSGPNLSGYYAVEKAYVLDKATRDCYQIRDGEKLLDHARMWEWHNEPVTREEFARRVQAHPGDMIWALWIDGIWRIGNFNEPASDEAQAA